MLRGAAGDARHRGPVRLRVVGAMQQAETQIDIGRRLTVADRVALLQQGGEVGGETASEFAQFLAIDIPKWRKIATDAQLTP